MAAVCGAAPDTQKKQAASAGPQPLQLGNDALDQFMVDCRRDFRRLGKIFLRVADIQEQSLVSIFETSVSRQEEDPTHSRVFGLQFASLFGL